MRMRTVLGTILYFFLPSVPLTIVGLIDDTTLEDPFEYVSGWTGAAGFTHRGQMESPRSPAPEAAPGRDRLTPAAAAPRWGA